MDKLKKWVHADPAPVILNVDDHEGSRYARNRILSGAGFEVHDAGTGEATLDYVAKFAPDLILLDVHLPDIDGIEVCRRLKATPVGPALIIVQISASATGAPHATAALNSGADAYLTEPIDAEVLIATVRAMLRLRRAERDLSIANVRLQALNAELRRSNEDLQQFAYIASHDLQEPLRNVSTFVELIAEKLAGKIGPEIDEYFNHVIAGA